MADNEISVRIVGDASSAQSAAQLSADAVQKAAAVMKTGLAQVQETAKVAFGTLSTGASEGAQAVEAASTRTSTALARMNASAGEVTRTSGNMKFAMRDLSYQLSDISTMFAMGAPPMMIFSTQAGQVIGALQMMAGEAKGLLGFLGGPWGMVITAAATALTPLIGRLFDTGDAAKNTEDRLRSAADAAREYVGASNALKLVEAKNKLNDLASERLALENKTIAPGYGEAGRASADAARRNRDERLLAIAQEELALRNVVNLADEANAAMEATVRPRSAGSSGSSGGSRVSRSRGGGTGAQDAAREELQARQAASQQIEALAEDQARTDIELSQMALRAKLADIDAELRAGTISAAQAIRSKAAVNDKIEALDRSLQARLFAAKMVQLEVDRRNYLEGTAEYARYTQQIDLLRQQYLNRVRIADAKAATQDRAARQQALAADTADLQRAEAQRRSIMAQAFRPFAQQLAQMLTLQRGFFASIRDMWSNLVSLVGMAVARMVETWLVGLATQEAASSRAHMKQVLRDAKQAASGAWKAMAGIPVIGPILAPPAAAAAFAGVMAFSAKGGYDVPALAGPGIDGKGGQVGIVHPKEMVLPAEYADMIRSGSASGGVHVHLHGAVINGSRELKRFAEANAAQLSAAGKKYARNGGR